MAGSSPKPWVYWDTSLLISFLTGVEADKMKQVQTLLEEVVRQPAPYGVVFSQYTRAELRDYAGDDPIRRKMLDDFFRALKPTADAIRWYPVDRIIGARAADIGSRFKNLTPPDAIHVATALQSGAVRIWTYDGIRRDGTRRSGKLASLDGLIDGLRISEPDSNKLLPLFDDKVATTRGHP